MERAKSEGFAVVALADHDTTLGLAAAGKRAAELDMACMPCVELSVGRQLEIHLLGYGVDPDAPELAALLDEMRRDRVERVRAMAEGLQKAGYPVDYEQVRARAGGAVGRPHIAQVLVEAGVVSSTAECFAKLIGKDAPFYVPRKKLSTRRGIEAVRSAGGVAVLAHPGQLRLSQQDLFGQIQHMKEEGLQGLECYHNAHAPATQDWLRATCKRLALLVTGGSDFHGAAKPNVKLGSGLERWDDAWACLDRLREAMGQGAKPAGGPRND